jgi:hypothetical protein
MKGILIRNRRFILQSSNGTSVIFQDFLLFSSRYSFGRDTYPPKYSDLCSSEDVTLPFCNYCTKKRGGTLRTTPTGEADEPA